MIHPHVKRM